MSLEFPSPFDLGGSGESVLSFSGLGSGAANSDKKAVDEYLRARSRYFKSLDNYWENAEQQKKNGERVEDFPPRFAGPPKPDGFEAPPQDKSLPSVNTMIRLSAGLKRVAEHDPTQPDFQPRVQLDETSFKSNYVHEALVIGKKFGLGLEQMRPAVEQVYRFECGGRTGYDSLSGVPFKYSDASGDAAAAGANLSARRGYVPKSTGIGYTQILMATTLRHIDLGGGEIASRLRALGKESGRVQDFDEKAHLVESLQKLVHEETAAYARHNKGKGHDYYDKAGQPLYYLYQDFAKSTDRLDVGLTGRQLASGIQALLVDGDVGPVIQARQLGEVIGQAMEQTNEGNLKAKLERDRIRAEAFDNLPDAKKHQAVDELLARAGARKSEAFTSLRDKLYGLGKGLSDALSVEKLSLSEYNYLNDRVLDMRHPAEKKGKESPLGLLIDKVRYVYSHGAGIDQYRPAFMELINLSGIVSASAMVRPENLNSSTVNFFERQGYHGNAITNRRSAGELIDAIYNKMQRLYFRANTPTPDTSSSLSLSSGADAGAGAGADAGASSGAEKRDNAVNAKYPVLEQGVAQFEVVFDKFKQENQPWR